MKTHLKLKGKAICGVKKKKNPLKFASENEAATCGNCLRAVKE
jgi:hypothetical protein